MLSNDHLQDALVVDTVKAIFDLPKGGSIAVQRSSRLYSTTWMITVSEGNLSEVYFVKSAGDRTEMQARLSARANEIFRGDPLYVSLDVRYEPKLRLLISPAFSGRSLATLMADGAALNPFRWYRDLTHTLRLTGTWLKRYHNFDRHPGSLSEPLMRYLEGRKEKLDQLTPTSRKKLVQLVGEDMVDNLVVTHSDFSPANILSNGHALCVVDFGISEWTEMSPWWDVLTLIIKLDSYFLFRKITKYWARPLLSRLKNTFLTEYGSPLPDDCRPFLACAAVRHFSLARGFTADAFRKDSRSRWHADRLENLLNNASHFLSK